MLARTTTSATLALAAAVLLAPAPRAAADGAATTSPAETTTTLTRSAGELSPERVQGVAGKVSDATSPLASAQVYLYRVSDLELVKAVTDERGHFLFDTLPAGLYKVIAHKAGFVPAVVQLTRTTARAYQFLELELAAARNGAESGEDFWSLRSQVPTDVLRDVQLAEIQDQTRRAGHLASQPGTFLAPEVVPARMAARMTAMTGVDGIGAGEGQVHRGEVGIEGQVGHMKLGLSGDYLEVGPALGQGTAGPVGSAHNLSLSARDDDMSVRLESRNDRLASPEQRGEVGFETYRLAVSHDIGERGRSDFIAQYSSETNFHRHGWIDPRSIPEESRSWRLEGTYTAELTERASLQTGIRYRERTSGFGFTGDGDEALAAEALNPVHQRVDFFGRAGHQVQPSVLVEYGLYTTLRDGSVSLSPRGGMIVQLAPAWQASMAASYKVHDEGAAPYSEFMPTLRTADTLDDSCEQNDGHCYQLVLTHQANEDDSLSFGATHRRFDETQRVYFSDDLIDRYESLYLVPGDEIPEVQLEVTRRLTPGVTTRFQSNVAEGGGGVFLATDSRPYENRVSYLVTSLDTHFDHTSTGLFLAFHRLEQALERAEPEASRASREATNQLDVERLELMVTQDLNFLIDMATEMALQLNMQVSRGSWPFVTDESHDDRDELRKRLMGGIALRF